VGNNHLYKAKSGVIKIGPGCLAFSVMLAFSEMLAFSVMLAFSLCWLSVDAGFQFMLAFSGGCAFLFMAANLGS
jgi:hypothetical protein